jgi:hypothetical protein
MLVFQVSSPFKERSEMTSCSECGREVDDLEVFPKGRCLECHASAPETQHENATMTAEKLAAMFGGPTTKGTK